LYRGERIAEPVILTPGAEFSVGPVRLRVEVQSQLDAPTSGEMLPGNIQQDTLIGQVIHGYRIVSLAATGKAGTIYRAIHEPSAKPIAFKVMHPQLTSSDDQRERFVRAMRNVLPIEHRNIVRVYNAGRKGKLCWSAMEWVDGVGVDALIARNGTAGASDWEDVWRVAVHISRALEEANRHQLIHRNITPSNILRRDSDKVFLLNDLCLAKALDETDAAQLTKPGDVLGELSYLAPERLVDPACADHRVDYYSLGCTLYALLVGRPPIQAKSIKKLEECYREQKIVPPRFRRPGINERFEDIVLRLIARQPIVRYQSASHILRDLKEVGRRKNLEADWVLN
jgi:serine/threonine-protein kinase